MYARIARSNEIPFSPLKTSVQLGFPNNVSSGQDSTKTKLSNRSKDITFPDRPFLTNLHDRLTNSRKVDLDFLPRSIIDATDRFRFSFLKPYNNFDQASDKSKRWIEPIFLLTNRYARSDRTIFIRIARPLTFYRKITESKEIQRNLKLEPTIYFSRYKERGSTNIFLFRSSNLLLLFPSFNPFPFSSFPFIETLPTNRENSASTGSIIAKVVLIYCCALIRAEIVSPNGTWNGKLKNTFSFLESGGNVIGQGNGTNFHPRIDISTKESRPRINRRKYFFSFFSSSSSFFFIPGKKHATIGWNNFFLLFLVSRQEQGNRPNNNNLTEHWIAFRIR